MKKILVLSDSHSYFDEALKIFEKGVAFFKFIPYNITRCPGVAQLVARLTGGQEAVSSSLATRTKRVRT